MSWWHSGDTNSRTDLLLFQVGFNPLIGSCRFLRIRTFVTRKLWRRKMGGVRITSEILLTFHTEMGIYSCKVYDLKINKKGLIKRNVTTTITRKLG